MLFFEFGFIEVFHSVIRLETVDQGKSTGKKKRPPFWKRLAGNPQRTLGASRKCPEGLGRSYFKNGAENGYYFMKFRKGSCEVSCLYHEYFM